LPQTAFSKLLAELNDVSGRRFEQLCRWFLLHDPIYGGLLKEVWLWDDWPGRWGRDKGIDLIAEAKDGQLWAIQAKQYAPDYSVKKADIDTFLSESNRPQIDFRLLIATTNNLGGNAREVMDGQEKPVSLLLRSDLEGQEIQWSAFLAELAPTRPSPKTPEPHQDEAIKGVLAGFKAGEDRGQLIMACGTGKTLVSLWLHEKLHSQKTLVLVPSLSLLKQTLGEWRANALEQFEFLPVCSDKSVSGKDNYDAAIDHVGTLGFPVTNSVVEVAAFLRKQGPRVVFSTYQSSPLVAEALHDCPGFDFIVADEAHRCAGPGAKKFATVLDNNKIPGRRRLFATATPRFYTDRVQKEANEEDYEIASMDDTQSFGPVFHRLSFGEAIERDLLADYRVLVIGVDDPMCRELAEAGSLVTVDGSTITDARSLSSQIGLAKAVRDCDLHRIITFHSRVESARKFASTFLDVIRWIPEHNRPSGEIWTEHVSGNMNAGQRAQRIDKLKHLGSNERGLLSNARCLAEGVDVPTLDGVAFIDPKRSAIDIAQAVGRAIRKVRGAKTQKVGTIVIPVYVASTESPETMLEGSAFEPVWSVVRALREHDEHIAEKLDELRRELGRHNKARIELPTKLIFDLPKEVGLDFAHAFNVRLVERTTANWEFMFGLLETFTKREGDALVSQGYKEGEFKLGQWVSVQRRAKKKEQLSKDKIQCLEALPKWSWDPLEDDWEEAFALLKTYVAREGDALVPQGYKEGKFNLGTWVSNQRRAKNKGKLSKDRIQRLEALPKWSWDRLEDDWEEAFALLKTYVAREGDARVSAACKEGEFKLGQWVRIQRYNKKQGKLSKDKIQRLEALPGWKWDFRKK